eukprot:1185096-Prorocentrum_minimum.AAC.2
MAAMVRKALHNREACGTNYAQVERKTNGRLRTRSRYSATRSGRKLCPARCSNLRNTCKRRPGGGPRGFIDQV